MLHVIPNAAHAEVKFCKACVDSMPSRFCILSKVTSVIGGLQVRQSPPSKHIPAFPCELPESAIPLPLSCTSANAHAATTPSS